MEIMLSRADPSERLGLELLPPRGLGIEVGSINPGGGVDNCNQALRSENLGDGTQVVG